MFTNALSFCGIFDGIFLYGMRNIGEALFKWKVISLNAYGTANTSQANLLRTGASIVTNG